MFSWNMDEEIHDSICSYTECINRQLDKLECHTRNDYASALGQIETTPTYFQWNLAALRQSAQSDEAT